MNYDITRSLPHSGNIHRVVLPNGIVVLAYHNSAVRSVNIQGSLSCGSVHEHPDEDWVASFTAMMLMRGTRRRNADTLAANLEDIGADLFISGQTFITSFSGKALAEDFSYLLETLHEVLREPTFPEDELELQKQRAITAHQTTMEMPSVRVGYALEQLLYPKEHPMYPKRGEPEAVEAIRALTRDKLEAFHARVYSPQRMIVIVVGAVEPLFAQAEVERIFSDWEGPEISLPTVPEVPPLEQVVRVHTHLPAQTQTYIKMGALGPRRVHPDFEAVAIAKEILGGFGMMGRLGASIREENGLAYTASSSFISGPTQSVWNVSMGVADHHVELAIQKAHGEIRRLAEELVDEEELAAVKESRINIQPLVLETSSNIATIIERMERYNLGLDYLLHYPEHVNAVTREDVRRVTAQYLNPDALGISTAGSGPSPTAS